MKKEIEVKILPAEEEIGFWQYIKNLLGFVLFYSISTLVIVVGFYLFICLLKIIDKLSIFLFGII